MIFDGENLICATQGQKLILCSDKQNDENIILRIKKLRSGKLQLKDLIPVFGKVAKNQRVHIHWSISYGRNSMEINFHTDKANQWLDKFEAKRK